MNTQPQDIIDIGFMHSHTDTAEIALSTDNQPFDSHKWELMRRLQTSLDVEKIFAIFYQQLENKIAFHGAIYETDKQNLQLQFGTLARHHVEYTFNLHSENFGKVTFYRDNKFENHELEQIEDYLCLLAYPLRNALHYREALHHAHIDALTSINNRSGYESTLAREWELAKRHHCDLSLLIIDIDNFKSINDNYGHQAGDQVLKHIAKIVATTIRDSDLLYRYGGDELTAILRNTPQAGALILAERIRLAVAEHAITYKQAPIRATVSIGIACAHDCHHHEQMQEKADAALYRAKNDGKDLVSL